MLNPQTGELEEDTITIRPTDGAKIKNYRSPELISKLRERGERTPDFNELKMYKRIPVFVYGLEKFDGADSALLENAEYLGRAHTISSNYVMKHNNYFPVAFPADSIETTVSRGHIRGEMYNVAIEHIMCLDRANTNTKIFRRVKSRFILEDQHPEFLKPFGKDKWMPGFMYIGCSKWFEKAPLKLSPRTVYSVHDKLKDKPYFQWVNKDEDDIYDDEWGYGGAHQIGFWRHGE